MRLDKKKMIAATIVACTTLFIAIGIHEKKDTRKQLKFGATYMTMNNPYFVNMDENIEESVQAKGDILITRDPLQDQKKQNEQIKDMINEGLIVIRYYLALRGAENGVTAMVTPFFCVQGWISQQQARKSQESLHHPRS